MNTIAIALIIFVVATVGSTAGALMLFDHRDMGVVVFVPSTLTALVCPTFLVIARRAE